MNSEQQYIYLSQKYGTHLDWFQAGGGNISVKDDNILYIKESGTYVCDGKYVKCDLSKLLDELDNDAEDFSNFIISSNQKIPSIEVWFHAFTKKYTLHCHPTELYDLLFSNEAIEKINELNINNYLIIPYEKPGKELAQYMYNKYCSNINNYDMIFLLNHGIIITADTLEEFNNIIETILKPKNDIFEIQNKFNNKLIWQSKYYLNPNTIKNYTPDIILYLDAKSLFLYNNKLYIITDTKKQYNDIEEMIAMYLLIQPSEDKLVIEDINSIIHWEREKLRKNL
jgi:rhamnose utilization protein RhaD (predicted bifunctional aldolase and dehydrogenase)